MRATIMHTGENRPATGKEIDKLVSNGDLHINYYLHGSVNQGVVWIELSTIGETEYHIKHE